MIGISQIKKRLLNGILIGTGIGLVMVIITLIITNSIIKGYKDGTNKQFNEKYMTEVVTFNRDIIQGETIVADMVQTAKVHNATLPKGVYKPGSSLIGKIAKYNIPRNVAVTSSMLADEIIGTDVRIQEINSLVLPSDLAVNEFVDVRIKFPSGVEYIVLAQKKIKDIINTTIKLDLSEEEILILNGSIVDSYINDGSKLYAVKYTDPTTQIKIDDVAMQKAKTNIQNKIIEELLLNKIIREAPDVAIQDTTSTTENQTDITEEAIDTETISTKDSDEETTEETVNPTSILKKYNFETSSANANLLLELVTKYAIEYRYYVESYNKIVANYQPNPEIIRFMRTNAYVLEAAKEKLSEDARTKIETSIISFENSTSDESYRKVISGLTESINTQKTLRQSVMNNKQQ